MESGYLCRSHEVAVAEDAQVVPLVAGEDPGQRPHLLFDYIGFYPGETATAANRPQLTVTYQ